MEYRQSPDAALFLRLNQSADGARAPQGCRAPVTVLQFHHHKDGPVIQRGLRRALHFARRCGRSEFYVVWVRVRD